MKGQNINISNLKKIASNYGDSVIVAGSRNKARIHLHTNYPPEVVYKLRAAGSIIQQKVDDMKRQHEARFNRSADIALVTDSACDLPQEIMDEYQINMVPLTISFGEEQFLDKATITPDQFHTLLDEKIEYPQTSQPTVKDFANLYSFLLKHYKSIISLHISKKLSGTWGSARAAAKKFTDEQIAVINTKHLSTSMGLITQ